MDGESVRSGRSEKSDRSRRSKRTQRSNNVQGSQSNYIYQSHSKNGHPVCSTSNPVPQQPLIFDQNMQHIDPNRPSIHDPMIMNMQQPPLNMSQQPIALSPSMGHPYTMDTWNPHNVPMNQSFPNPQPTLYASTSQGWLGQPMQQAYPQQLMGQPMPNHFTRPSLNMPPNPNQPQQQQQIAQFMPTGQHPLTNTVAPHTPSQLPNCQLPQLQTSQIPDSYRPDRFDARIPQQDENAWVEDATAVTGATSETGLSGGDNFSRFGARYGLAASLGMHANGGSGGGGGISGAAAALIRSEADNINPFKCSHTVGFLLSALLGLSSLFSPILMLLLPVFPFWIGWSTEACEPNCEGHLIGISIKLVLLSVALWFLGAPCRSFCGDATAILPRVRLCRTLFLCLVFIVLFAFWLFYTVRVIQPKEPDYLSIVLFAGSLTDTLLFLHYAGIALMELRRIRFHYAIHIVRSPDGVSKTFKCGEMSLQHAALEVLQFYMLEFTAYNPNQSSVTNSGGSKRSRRGAGSASGGGNGGGSKYKFYDVDGAGSGLGKGENNVTYTVDQPACGATAPSASVRLYEEVELEKRIRKRRMRLLLAVEEAFTHVKRLANENYNATGNVLADCEQTLLPFNSVRSNGRMSKLNCSTGKPLDPYEAAQAVFPTLIRPLQKYMRVTRQQARHPVDTVIDHLALCLAYSLSPYAFLERFNPSATTPQQDAAAAASAITTAKRARKQQLQQQKQQVSTNKGSSHENTDTGPLLPKYVHPGGQQTWSIVADRALSRSLTDGVIFQLRRGNDLSLLCTVRRLPLIYLIEEILEPMEAGRFVLRTDNAV